MRLVLASAVAVFAIGVGAAVAGPPRTNWSACRKARTCPSSTHAYAWRGLVCGSKRAAADTRAILYRGRRFYCHAKAHPTPPPPPAPDPVQTFAPRVAKFLADIAAKAQELSSNITGGDDAARADAINGLENCAATLSSDVGVAPNDPTVQMAMTQLGLFCAYVSSSGSAAQDGVATGNASLITQSTVDLQEATKIADSIKQLLGIT